MKFVNLTPHSIVLNDGREFPSEGNARVTDFIYRVRRELDMLRQAR